MYVSGIHLEKTLSYPCTGPEGSISLKVPELLDSWYMKMGFLSAQRTDRLYPLRNIPGTHFY